MIVCDLCGAKGLTEEDQIQSASITWVFNVRPRDMDMCKACVDAIKSTVNHIQQKYRSVADDEIQAFVKDYREACRVVKDDD